MGILDAVKEVMGEMDKKVRVRRFLYDQLLEHSHMDEQQAELLANKILIDHFASLEEAAERKEAKEQHDSELVPYYTYLEAYLKATVGRPIEIGITNEMIGHERGPDDTYTLEDFELSQKYNYLKLGLQSGGRRFPISFEKISNIKFLDAGGRLKVWIDMTHQPTWRFWLEYDASLVIDFPFK